MEGSARFRAALLLVGLSVEASCGGRSALDLRSTAREGTDGNDVASGGRGPSVSGAGGTTTGPDGAATGGASSTAGGAPSTTGGVGGAGAGGTSAEGGYAGEGGGGGEEPDPEPGDVLWAVRFEGDGYQQASDIAVRDDGESFVTGHAAGATDFGLGPVQGTSAGEAFLVELDPEGHIVEGRLFEGTGMGHGLTVELAPSGALAVAGTFDGTIDFGTLTMAADPGEKRDGFLVRFDEEGTDVGTVQLAGTANQAGSGVALSHDGRALLSVGFEGVDNGAVLFDVENNADIEWSASAIFDANYQERVGAADVALASNGDAVVAGSFHDTMEVCGQELTSVAWRDVFLARYDPTGACLWSKRLGDDEDGDEIVMRVAHHGGPSERFAIAGYGYADSEFFDPEKGDKEAFVYMLDGQGTLLYERIIGGPGEEYAYSLAFDDDGNLFVAGFYNTDSGHAQHGILPASFAGTVDIFVVKYDAVGDLVWARRYGGEGHQWAMGIDADAEGYAYVTGNFDGELESSSSPAGNYEGFVLKLRP